jgi:UDP-N-acetylmuramate--alanine ligase
VCYPTGKYQKIHKMQLSSIKKVYFLGIGGIGMSALARYFMQRGCVVAGYDRTETELTKTLAGEGMLVHYSDDLATLKKVMAAPDLIIYTPAVSKNEPNHTEYNYLKNSGLPMKKRAEVLGIISRGMKCMAVAGTHGKTSTSTILTHILRVGGVDCTAFLGGISNDLGSNFVVGKSDWVVVEADEYDRSFLHLTPEIAIINSMDPDHLDIYGTAEEMRRTYRKFAFQTRSHLFFRTDLRVILNKKAIFEKQDFSFQYSKFNIEKGDYQAKNVRVEDGFFVFDIKSPIENIKNIKFTLPGNHNVLNATAAIAAAQQIGITGEQIKAALASFKGIHRRFEFVIRTENRVLIDDYAHHPDELNAAIGAAKMLYPNRKIVGVFQPHLFSRTRDFVDGFAASLDQLDTPILLPIYPAREEAHNFEGVTSDIIFSKMKNPNKQLLTKEQFLQYVKTHDNPILMMLGAGDIDKMVSVVENMKYEI